MPNPTTNHACPPAFPRTITARKLIQEVVAHGFTATRIKGSHRIYHHPDGRRLIIPTATLGETLSSGMLHKIAGMLR